MQRFVECSTCFSCTDDCVADCLLYAMLCYTRCFIVVSQTKGTALSVKYIVGWCFIFNFVMVFLTTIFIHKLQAKVERQQQLTIEKEIKVSHLSH